MPESLMYKYRFTPDAIPSKTSYRLKILDITESVYILSLGKSGEKSRFRNPLQLVRGNEEREIA